MIIALFFYAEKLATQKRGAKLLIQDNLDIIMPLNFSMIYVMRLLATLANLNTAWHTWKEISLEIGGLRAPVKQRKLKSEYKPWLSYERKKNVLP